MKSMVEKAEQGVLKWFGNMVRMREERLTQKMYVTEVEGTKRKGKPNWRWKDVVRFLCSESEHAGGKRCAWDTLKWSSVVD